MKKKVREWRLNQIENINRQNLWKEFLILELSIIELKSKITEMKNSLEGLSNRFEQAEEGIHEQDEKTTLRMGENICKWSNWQTINLQDLQAAHAAQ